LLFSLEINPVSIRIRLQVIVQQPVLFEPVMVSLHHVIELVAVEIRIQHIQDSDRTLVRSPHEVNWAPGSGNREQEVRLGGISQIDSVKQFHIWKSELVDDEAHFLKTRHAHGLIGQDAPAHIAIVLFAEFKPSHPLFSFLEYIRFLLQQLGLELHIKKRLCA
jgi:hypothetical protein